MKSPSEPLHGEGGLGSALKVKSLLQTAKVNSDGAYSKFCSLHSRVCVLRGMTNFNFMGYGESRNSLCFTSK